LNESKGDEMEFLVRGEMKIPDTISPENLEALKQREMARGAELAASGVFLRQWRVPGRREVWTLWEAADASELQAALESLALYPYFEIEIHPLADHPRDPQVVARAAVMTGVAS
jgi:muconolactone D-isomerase